MGKMLLPSLFLYCVISVTKIVLSENFTEVTGDLMLGGLFPIHGFTDGKCSHINEQDGIQRLEAALFSLDEINKGGMLPGFSMGLIAKDTCFSKNFALQHSLAFAQKRFDSVNSTDNDDVCGLCKCKDGSSPTFESVQQTSKQNNLIGVIGPATSEESVSVATLLKLFQVPQVSYFATSPELADQQTFPYFKRTVPSDHYQARAIIHILKYAKWEYVSAIYEDSSYGVNGFAEIEKIASAADICFGLQEKVSLDESDADLITMAERLMQYKNRNGQVITILYVQFDLAMRIQEIVRTKYGDESVVWVGSDAWTARGMEASVPTVNNVISYGSIGITPLTQMLPNYTEYFQTLKPSTNTRDVWFREYWEHHFNCKFDNVSALSAKLPVCNEKEGWGKNGDFQEFPTLYSVRNAVFAFGQAMKNIHKYYCGKQQGLCPEMKSNLNGETVLQFLSNIRNPFGVDFVFINGTEGPPHYSILQYTKQTTQGIWQSIGNFSEQNGDTSFYINGNKWIHSPSVCSAKCDIGQHRVRETDCCWTCANCEDFEFVNSSNPYLCRRCPDGEITNIYRNDCVPMAIEFLSYSNPYAIVACTLSSIGVLACVFAIVVFIRNRDTPIVKASGFEASLILLLGIFIAFSSTFVLVSKPTPATCGAVRFSIGLSFTIAYAAMFTKLVILYCVFNIKDITVANNITGQKKITKKKIMSPKGSVIMSSVLILFHLAVIAMWMAIDPPNIVRITSASTRALELVCGDAITYSYLGNLSWPFILMICCLVFAIKTRKLPDGFNESHHVAYCAYSSFLLWLGFVPLYAFGESNLLRIIFISCALFIHATVCLSALFVTKLYIILRRPEKNTRDRVMSRTSNSPVPSGLRSSVSSYSYNPNGSRRGSDIRPDKDIQFELFNSCQNNIVGETTNEYCKRDLQRTDTLPFAKNITRTESFPFSKDHVSTGHDLNLIVQQNCSKDIPNRKGQPEKEAPLDYTASLGFRHKNKNSNMNDSFIRTALDRTLSNSDPSLDTKGSMYKRHLSTTKSVPYTSSNRTHLQDH